MLQKSVLLRILFCAALGPSCLANSVVINEFMASNSGIVKDPQGQYDDWIELYNPTETAIDVGGMYLTDDLANPTQWRIPQENPLATTIPAQGFLLIWADEDTDGPGLHSVFRLSARGEELGLYDSDGSTLLDSLRFDVQQVDVSQGRFPDGGDVWRSMYASPTPGKANVSLYTAAMAAPKVSHKRGFYDTAFQLTLSTNTAGALIYYTLDGREPCDQSGRSPIGEVYEAPISVSRTSTLRVRAIGPTPEWMPSCIVTHSYLFLDDVIRQPKRPPGFPTNWGHTGAGDYEMDPEVVDSPVYRDSMIESLTSIPSLSLVMHRNDWFGPDGRGIYIRGELDERVVSAEYILPDNIDGFQIDGTVMIVGGSSPNRWKMDKLSMRLKFTGDHGPSKLRYPLFEDGATDEFDTLVVDARMNNSWAYGGGVPVSRPGAGQRDLAQYTRDQFAADIQNSMGGFAPHGKHVHLYLNGLYWGLYWLHERPDEHFAAASFGGRDDDYDVLKHSAGRVVHGSGSKYQEMLSLADSGLSNPERYQALQQVLDVPGLIDYLIMNYYIGNTDWAHHNWYATCSRVDPQSRWRFHSWDAEHVMEGLHDDRTRRNNAGAPTGLHYQLLASDDYRLQFADQVHRHFFNQGILTPDAITDLYQVRLDEVYRAVVAESARWGDNHRATPYTRNIEWITERDWLQQSYFPERAQIVLNQIKSRGWYPDTDAPFFLVNDAYQHGGSVEAGAILTIANPREAGDIYYTMDGSDPRFMDITGGPSTVLVAGDVSKRFVVPNGPLDPDWPSLGFDDSAWAEGVGGIGFELGWDYQDFIDVDLFDTMWVMNASCLFRIPFQVDDPAALGQLIFHLRYDDGFVAYLNGVRVAAEGAPAELKWDSNSTYAHEADSEFARFDISAFIHKLVSGENLLAIHGLNASSTSPDFLIEAELIAKEGATQDMGLYSGPLALARSGRIKARLFKDDQWSALNEAVYGVGPVREFLRISELMYHPPDPNKEFIELTNIGEESLNLNLVQFTNGIDFGFSDIELEPGGFLLVVRDLSAFTADGLNIPIAGEYTGNLSNGGERIRLEDALGGLILDFRYNDSWYVSTDGDGLSLELADALNADPNSRSEKNAWRPSENVGGSPGW
jgi:hypothetical protein